MGTAEMKNKVNKSSFEIMSIEPVDIILDASDSAENVTKAIVDLTGKLLAVLPAKELGNIYFLGNNKAYGCRDFERGAAPMFLENRGCCSLINPAWSACKSDSSRSLVIGSGTIFDLEDWEGTAKYENAVFVSIGSPLGIKDAYCLTTDDVHETIATVIAERLASSVSTVEIKGPGFMPLNWGNSEFVFSVGGNEASLRAENVSSGMIEIEYIQAGEQKPQATITFSDGRRTHYQASNPSGESALPSARRGMLTEDEAEIFHKAIKKEKYICPLCSGSHGWQMMRCRHRSSIIGTPVYSSINACRQGEIVIFREKKDGIDFLVYESGIFHIGNHEVLINGKGGLLKKYRYDGEQGWLMVEEMQEPYQPLGESRYALAF